MNCAELDSFLYPYLDGEFDFPERADFERHLAECAACAGKVSVQAQFHNSFRAALQRAAAVKASPAGLRERILSEINQGELHWLRNRWIAAAAAVALVGLGGAYWLRPQVTRRFVEDAALRHAKAFDLGVQELPNEVVEAWFEGKLDHRVSVPHFPNAHVTGARISHVEDKPAAHISYERFDRHGGGPRRMGLFVFDDAKREMEAGTLPSVRVAESHGYNVAFWREGEIVYELVSDLDEQDIRTLVETSSRWAKTDEPLRTPDPHATHREPMAPFQTPNPTVPASFIPASFQQ